MKKIFIILVSALTLCTAHAKEEHTKKNIAIKQPITKITNLVNQLKRSKTTRAIISLEDIISTLEDALDNLHDIQNTAEEIDIDLEDLSVLVQDIKDKIETVTTDVTAAIGETP